MIVLMHFVLICKGLCFHLLQTLSWSSYHFYQGNCEMRELTRLKTTLVVLFIYRSFIRRLLFIKKEINAFKCSTWTMQLEIDLFI